MSAFSDYLENKLLEVTLRGDTYTGGAVYVSLFTADPTDDATTAAGVEADYDDYERVVAHATPSEAFSVASGGSTSNSALIEFPAVGAGTASITVTHWGIWSALTNGNLLYHAPLTNSKTLETADKISFPVGALTIQLT